MDTSYNLLSHEETVRERAIFISNLIIIQGDHNQMQQNCGDKCEEANDVHHCVHLKGN